jgi:hypothetical protein
MATIDQGDYARAAALFQALIVEHKEARWTLPAGLEGMAAIAAAQGVGERAVRLWGAAEALRETTGLPMDVFEVKDYQHWVAAIRAQLDDATFAAAWAAGRTMTLEEAIAEALAGVAVADGARWIPRNHRCRSADCHSVRGNRSIQ